jgi:hypothetical protein
LVSNQAGALREQPCASEECGHESQYQESRQQEPQLNRQLCGMKSQIYRHQPNQSRAQSEKPEGEGQYSPDLG